MFSFARNISFPVRRELVLSRRAMRNRNQKNAFKHLENAHVLGQLSTYWHTRVHWLMFVWAWQQHDFRELRGQTVRLVGAITKTAIGLLPTGNTGGSNVSAFMPMPLSTKHHSIITRARLRGDCHR
ncbi:DUF3703 domain-containing protein [Alteromonas confluentis]|uniref:DUF3703 domain-containing protein n=1 Tax=Alteromonas confluentis TaxID=1656094 RepID=A0A1E7Z6L0_9ALTE|nr:DUF3703 domain-containing protein [Alteromonas confluentis]OFC69165.1 hypothetical protein BFC18_20780 [Alteromonas confluentis]